MAADSKEYHKALAYLNERIADGSLKIGSRLPTERALAEELSISRNSTREALRMLENSGVIESKRGSGSYLVGDMQKSIAHMLQMMLLLKQTDKYEIVEFRRSVDKAVCSALLKQKDTSWIEKSSEVLSRRATDIEHEIAYDTEFHYTLITATGNHFWITLMDAISDIYQGWVSEGIRALPSTNASFNHAHTALLEALKARNRDACEHAIDKHYDDILELLK